MTAIHTADHASRPGPSRFEAAVSEFLAYLRVRNYAPGSITAYSHALGLLRRFLAERAITDPAQVTPQVLESYRHHLARLISTHGQPLSVATQSHRLQAARVFFRWAYRHGHLPHNPAEGLDPPVAEHRLPPATLSVEEIEAVMAVPDIATVFGLRDRAMLEVFYSTGIRRSELIGLRVRDLDAGRGTLFISQGKGHKDRYVPIGTRALHWLERYLNGARPRLALPGHLDEVTLFLAYTGKPLSRDFVSELVADYIGASGTAKRGSCHLIRHSVATLMLEGGADIRHIAELLGHSRLETTQRYTRVSIHQLRHVHALTHPGANLAR